MSIKTLSSALLAATCVLALGACAHSSTPSTTGAPSDPSSGGPAASQDPATAPMSGIIFAASDDGIDTTVTTVRAIDPQSGTITATRTFTFPSEYLSAPGYMCEYMQCYSPDFSRMIVANNDGAQMALYASPKDAYSDLSLHIFVAPVTGSDATQVTTTTEDVPGVVCILGWTQ